MTFQHLEEQKGREGMEEKEGQTKEGKNIGKKEESCI